MQRSSTRPPRIHSTNPRPWDSNPGSPSGAAPSHRSQRARSPETCVSLQRALACSDTERSHRGAVSEGLSLPTPPPPTLCFPGRILGFPQCKSWLSTLKCFNLLHPPRRALREARRRPGLRTIKQLPAGVAPVGAGRPSGEMGGPSPGAAVKSACITTG